MTYDSRERSADQGSPVELYTFNRDYKAWRYTSANADRVIDFQLYNSVAIKRSEIEQGDELRRSGLKLTVSRDFPVAAMFVVAPPSDAISLTLQQYHDGDGDLATIWTGRITDVRFQGSDAIISLESIYASMRRNGLRRHYMKPCPHVLYGGGCKANRSAFRMTAAIDMIVGTTVSAGELAAHPDGYWTGGYAEWESETGLFERRGIISHAGASVEFDTVPLGWPVGATVNFYPGCDHTITACKQKFDNVVNYGGMPYMSDNNPFGNDPLY